MRSNTKPYNITAMFACLALLLSIETAQGQMINAGAQMSIDQQTTLGIDMDFLNTGTLKNQGEILLTGNWMNVGVYDSAGGQLVFNSVEVQEIMNNGQEINNLVIRNGIKTLSDDLTITGNLSLNSGILQVKEEAKLTLGQGVLITGAGEDAYIDGKVFRVGTGDLFFPIGTSSEYLPVYLNDVDGRSPEVGISAFSSLPSQGINDNIQEIASAHHWEMFSDENYSSGFISLPITSGSISRLVVAQATGENENFNTLGNADVTTLDGRNFITSEAIAVGPYFATAIAPESAPLPPLKVVNVLTPLQDGKHDFLRIENIELYPDNRVEIFDRHGNKVFSMTNYDNRDRVFIGEPNNGISGQLPDGNYFYTIKTGRTKVTSGFLFLKR